MRGASRLFLVLLLLAGANTAGEVASAHRLRRRDVRWVRRTLRHMTLEEKVGQLFMIRVRAGFINPESPQYAQLRDTMLQYHLGSFAITVPVEDGVPEKPSALDAAALTNQLQADSALPLLFAADFERGVAMRFRGGTAFPHAMAFGATGTPEYAYQFGRITAEEGRAIGVQWNFYPDADVNSNPANPIINTRSFGGDPQQVSAFVTAFIHGVHAGGGMATAKHFPGHGDTSTDSHLALARVDASRQHLDQVELPPFRAAIAAGVDSVMIGHLLVPALDPDPNHVATVSHAITTDLLQHKLGFHGIVITDAMDMNGLMRLFSENCNLYAHGYPNPITNGRTNSASGTTSGNSVGGNPENGQGRKESGASNGSCDLAQASGQAAVAAIEAGADVILMPADLDAAYNAVLDAVRSGEIPQSRIDRSVRKLLRAKAALGLNRKRFVDLDAVPQLLEHPDDTGLAQQVADDSITLVRDEGAAPSVEGQPAAEKLLPLPPEAAPVVASVDANPPVAPAHSSLLVLVFTDNMRGDDGRVLVRELRARVPDARVLFLDDAFASLLEPQVMRAVAAADRVVAAVYVIPTAGRGVGLKNVGLKNEGLKNEGLKNEGLKNGGLQNGAAPSGSSPGLERGPASVLAAVLHSAAEKTVVVSLGNPYLISQYPEIRTYVCAYSNSPPSERAVVRFLFGENAAHGRLPVTIPGIAARGEGLTAPAAAAQTH